jgi:hypothetical protein
MKLKICLSIALFLLSTSLLLAQKKEKIKGSKVVTTTQKEVGSFNAIEVGDNLEIYLEKGEKNGVVIEADDNIHEIILLDLKSNTLFISTSKEVFGFNKLIVKVTYTKELNFITSKDESTIYAIQEIILDDISFKTFDRSKLFLNVNSKNFVLQSNDKSKTELNLKSENTFIELSKNSNLKALLNCTDLKCDLYQKSNATLEGDIVNATIRLDSNVDLDARNLTIKTADISSEGEAECSLLVENKIIIDAANESEIKLFGYPKIEIRKLANEAKLLKKEKTK